MATDPTTFTTTATLSKVACSWSSSGADGYRVYRKRAALSSYRKIYEGDNTVFAFDDFTENFDSSGVEIEYDYKVTAYDSGGESAGVVNNLTMPSITTNDLASFGALSYKLVSGGTTTTVSNTYNHASGTAAIDGHASSVHENRFNNGKYEDFA